MWLVFYDDAFVWNSDVNCNSKFDAIFVSIKEFFLEISRAVKTKKFSLEFKSSSQPSLNIPTYVIGTSKLGFK